MHSDYKGLYEAAKEAGACEDALVWMEQQEKPISELTQEEINYVVEAGYLNWVAVRLPAFKALVTPTPEQYERGLTDTDWYVRVAWVNRKGLTPSAAQYERGLTDEDCIVRLSWAYRKDLTPNPEQYERGITDENSLVRTVWAARKDLTPTPEQYERGLRDDSFNVRRVWAGQEARIGVY